MIPPADKIHKTATKFCEKARSNYREIKQNVRSNTLNAANFFPVGAEPEFHYRAATKLQSFQSSERRKLNHRNMKTDKET